MKLWQKICFPSLSLFLAVFTLAGILLIEHSADESTRKIIRSSLNEYKSMQAGIIYNIQTRNGVIFEGMDGKSKVEYKEALNGYLERIPSEELYFEVLDWNNRVIFSNLDFVVPMEREELKDPLLDRCQYIIRTMEGRKLLFITKQMRILDTQLKNTYIRDITYIDREKKSQYLFFIKIFLLSGVIMLSCVYLLSKFLTWPITQMIASTRKIADGNYSARVNMSARDELGILGKSYNEMAETVEHKIGELQKSMEEKQRFIDNFTHELRTPLTAVIGYADFMRSTAYEEKTFRLMEERIFKEGKRIEMLSEKMMDFISLNRNSFVLEEKKVKEIFEEARAILEPKLRRKEICLVVEYYDEDCSMSFEKDLIINLLINLIDNAIKASSAGSAIYLRLYPNREGRKMIEVADSGIGIPERELHSVLEPFYMVDKARSRIHNGVGLGLSICAEIAEIHHAVLQLDSVEGLGTSIKVIFST